MFRTESNCSWCIALIPLTILYLIFHYNTVKRRKPQIDFIVDKCINPKTKDGPPKKIVLIHGWPDHASLWKNQIPELTKKYDCYRIILPNFDIHATNYEGPSSWGYDLKELAESVNTCVETRILNKTKSKDEKVTLIIHDWGSVVGYLAYKFDRNNMYERIISIDVGDHIGVNGVLSFFVVIGYQWFNALCFLLPRIIGDVLNRFIPKLGKSSLVRENKLHEIHAGMNYLYFYLWWRVLTCRMGDIDIEHGDIFKVPFLFLYGDKTPLKFHTEQFARKMQTKPNGYVLLKGHSHWLMLDKKGEEFTKTILKWLEETDQNIITANGTGVN